MSPIPSISIAITTYTTKTFFIKCGETLDLQVEDIE